MTSVLEQVHSAKSHRVITLVGPPGFGKTSIAVAVGQRLVEEKEVGVVFVPLRGAVDKQQVANRIVTTLNPRTSEIPTDLKPLRDLVKALPANTLIVLDNAEDAISPEFEANQTYSDSSFDTVVNIIIGSNKSVKVLVTSRVKFQPHDRHVSEHLVGGLREESAKHLLGCLCMIKDDDHAVQIVRLCGHVPLAICIAAGIMKYEGLSSGELCSVSTSSSVCTIAPLGTLSSHRTFSLYVHSPANISRCLSLFSSFLFWSSQSTFQEARLRDPKHYIGDEDSDNFFFFFWLLLARRE